MMEVEGKTAMFTRPDSGDSPCSYPAPTYSAVRGMFESVLWGPAVEIIPNKVELCSPPQYHSYQEIFNRRLKRGQSYGTMCLGWSEFTVSYFGPFRENTKVCTSLPDIYIPSMLREVFADGCKSRYRPVYDNDLCIHKGVLVYPRRNEKYDK